MDDYFTKCSQENCPLGHPSPTRKCLKRECGRVLCDYTWSGPFDGSIKSRMLNQRDRITAYVVGKPSQLSSTEYFH